MRRAFIGACVAALLAAWPGAAAGASQTAAVMPLVGTWQFEGAKIKVTGSGGIYQGVIASGSYGACAEVGHPGFAAWKNLHASASGKNYYGTTPWYNTDGCSSIGDGQFEIRLSSTDGGSWNSTSPDGTTALSGTISRVGPSPPEPKTDCTKGGRRVLCGGAQTKIVKAQIKRGQQADKLGETIRKSKQALLDGTDTAADIYIDIMSYVVGGRPIELPTITLPRFTIDWRDVDLDTLLRDADFRGKDALVALYGFAKESDKALQYTNELMRDADSYYASSPDAKGNMDAVSRLVNGDRHYDDPSLTDEERFVVACNVTDLSGAKKKLINHMVELGKAGANVTHTLP